MIKGTDSKNYTIYTDNKDNPTISKKQLLVRDCFIVALVIVNIITIVLAKVL